MATNKTLSVFALSILFAFSSGVLGAPPITGSPTIDKPRLLDWPRDTAVGDPDLTEQTANRLFDLHGSITNCDTVDLVLSTAGNYHMALRDMWHTLLIGQHGADIKSWYYTTSPPISRRQIANNRVAIGNLSLECRPQVVAAPLGEIQQLQALGVTEGAPLPIFRNRGNVILVKKGNPKHIRNVWDLGRGNIRVVTPNPVEEKSTFDNYSNTIFDVALNDPNPPNGWSAERLFNSIFNYEHKHKWLAGGRIHHREVPWSIAYGRADAGILFYHLALHAERTFPDLFEIVPLGGTAMDPQPLPGNRVGAHYAVRISGAWNPRQAYAREKIMEVYASEEFKQILESHGLARP